MRRGAAALAGVVLGLAAVLGVASSASAHDQLVTSDPAEGATVTALSAVTLTYSEELLGAGDTTADLVAVTGPDGRHYETDCAAVDGAVVTVPVALGAAGEYTAQWRVVSADGHPVSGEVAFTYAPDETTDAAAGADSSPCAAVASAGTASGFDDATAGLVAGLSAGAVVIGILVVIVMVGLQARKKKEPSADDE